MGRRRRHQRRNGHANMEGQKQPAHSPSTFLRDGVKHANLQQVRKLGHYTIEQQSPPRGHPSRTLHYNMQPAIRQASEMPNLEDQHDKIPDPSVVDPILDANIQLRPLELRIKAMMEDLQQLKDRTNNMIFTAQKEVRRLQHDSESEPEDNDAMDWQFENTVLFYRCPECFPSCMEEHKCQYSEKKQSMDKLKRENVGVPKMI
jgi:hypothetical protein